MIRVANVRGLKGEARRGVCYVGRACFGWPGHALANPFKASSHDPAEIARVVEEYRRWFTGRLLANGDLVRDLWAECRRGELPIGCWCVNSAYAAGRHLLVRGDEVTDVEVPVTCHGQVLAEHLALRFQRPEGSVRFSGAAPGVWSDGGGRLMVTMGGATLALNEAAAGKLSDDLRAEIARLRDVQTAIRAGAAF